MGDAGELDVIRAGADRRLCRERFVEVDGAGLELAHHVRAKQRCWRETLVAGQKARENAEKGKCP